MDIPTKEESIFLKYLEEYLVNKEKENPNIKIWKIDLPWFTVFWIHESIIISKKFWFIKWLVENDKIDHDHYWNYALVGEWENGSYFQLRAVETILMLLSIQDNPIEFLISVLK